MFTKLYITVQTKAAVLKKKAMSFLTNEKGEVNVIAIIVILAIALALAFVFRTKIKQLFDSIWDTVTGNSDDFGSY